MGDGILRVAREGAVNGSAGFATPAELDERDRAEICTGDILRIQSETVFRGLQCFRPFFLLTEDGSLQAPVISLFRIQVNGLRDCLRRFGKALAVK